MNEALRLAYLDAMGITVWLPRADAETGVAAEDPVAGLAPPASLRIDEPPAAGAIRDDAAPDALAALRGALGGARRDTRAPPAEPAVPARRPVPQAGARIAAPTLLMASAGGILFVGDAAPEATLPLVADLLASLLFALRGERQRVRAEPFAPPGALLDASSVREAILGRVARLSEGAAFDTVILFGAAASAAMLGWDARRHAERTRDAQRIDGIDAPVRVTLGLGEVLEQPLLKRAMWDDLRALARPAAAAH